MCLRCLFTTPEFTLNNSIKSESSVAVSDFLARVSSNFKRCEPLATKFVDPVALSKRLISLSGVTNVSAIVHPTR